MQPDQAPCSASGRVEFPLSVTSCLRDQRDDASPLLGGVLSDSKLAWLSKGPLLEIVQISDGAKIAAWTFGAVVKDFKTKVTCVTELPHLTSTGDPGHIDQIIVGLECELTGGMLCLFNMAGSRVLRAINIPSKVTATNIVALGGENLGPLHSCLKSMSGIAAVGTNDGQILLIDLRRNDCDEALRSGHLTHWEELHDELQSCGLLSLKTVDSNLLEVYPDDHLYLHLNEKYLLKHKRLVVQFPLRHSTDFMPEDPSVTSLLYVPQLASLCVGFAFGSFQIWSLEHLSLVYTLPLNEPNPVVQLSFQEACDDPNAYCYLWTVRGGLSRSDAAAVLDQPVAVFGPPSATMFSLCYDEKVWLPGYGHYYKTFMMCSTGFEYDLCGGKDSVGGRLVSLYSISRGMLGPSVIQSPEDSCSVGPANNAMSLCLLVWETWGPTGPSSSVNPINTHMALFDINQWYVDQMPARLSQHGGSSRNKSVASYLVSFNLGNVISSSGGLLLDVRVNVGTLVQFSSVQNVEEFSRPSSLSFISEVLMERQVVHLKHPGVQRALLSDLMSTGPGALMTPSNIFHECLVLGLRPLLMDASHGMNIPVEEQRTFVLCVALEQRLGRFVCRCAREWADGRLSAAGCTISWLLSVAWNRAAVLKQLAIRICAQLFDHSGEKLDSNDQRQLHHIVGVFHLLETLFENVVRNKWHLALNEGPQVNLQNDALKLECQYYNVLQWLIDVDLLPEGLNPTVPYPAQDIAAFYHSRRLELHRLLKQQGEEKEFQELLLIDALLKNQPGCVNVFSEWERDAGGNASPGAGQYPPISLQALLRTFLVKDVALEVKHSVVIYVLMDLANILDNDRYQATLQNFMKFPAAFCMSVGSMRLTQAFWHLDHKAFDTALDMLLDPLVSVRDIVPWQHRCIIRLFALQGQANMALRYVRARRPPLQEQSDIKLHLGLLIANDLIDEAFMYQRSHRTEETAEILLSQFFHGCEERNHLRTLLQFSLDDDEEVSFSRYLESSRHPAADDLRVLYLLKRSRYVEALDVNQDLRKKGRSGGTRDVVVNGFYKTLPSVTRKLAAHCAQQQTKFKSWTQVEKPTPLFVNPKIASPQMHHKSSMLEAALEKSRETWAKLVDRIHPVMSEVESTPFLCTPRTKLSTRPRPASASVQKNEVKGGVDRKRPREDDSDNVDSCNIKRSRFQNLETALANLQQRQQQEKQKIIQTRYSTYSCTDTLPLLNTPVVQRRSPSTRAKLQQQIIACSPGHSTVAPQSIIKVRHASTSLRSESPKQLVIKDFVNDPELTEEESEPEPLSTSHKLSKGESETDSEPDHEEEEGLVGVTARRIIDFESDISSDLSLSQSSHDSHSPSPTLSPTKSSLSNSTSERSLSRMVVLSEARKAGKPVHSVTFGKRSICVYDQDEPTDTEVAIQDESSNDTVDQEPSRDENPGVEEDVKEKEPSYSTDEAHDDHVIINSQTQSSFRPLRLDTSGIGSMTASSSQLDFSHTEDSEVFLSADSSAQGTIYSPTFRKNLARRSVREIAQSLTGNKRSQVEDEDDIDEITYSGKDSEESVQQVRKSARLERGAQCASSLQHSIYAEQQKAEKSTVESGTPSAFDTLSADNLSASSLARPSIRKASHMSIGVSFDASQNDSGGLVNDSKENSEVLELFSAQSVSYIESEVSVKIQENVRSGSSAENLIELTKQASEYFEPRDVVESTVVKEPDIHSFLSHDLVEIVDLDDDSVDDGQGAEGMEEENEKVQEDSASSELGVSEDRGFISESSNICFRTSHIDHVDSSSESETNSSESKLSSENELLSDDSESNSSKEDGSENLSHIYSDKERSAGSSETKTSNEDSDFNKACVTDTSISADVYESESLKEACAVDSDDISADVSEPQMPFEDSNTNQEIVAEEIVVEPSEPQVSNEGSNPDVCEEVASSIGVGHDDMPRLRLDAATSNENLCQSPEGTVYVAPALPQTTPLETMDVEESTSTGEGAEINDQTIELLELPSPSPKNMSVSDVYTSSLVSVGGNRPVTPRSSGRKGSSRRSSVSSTKSETLEENRKATRALQKPAGSSNGSTSESLAWPENLEPLPEVEEVEEPLSTLELNRSKSALVSSQDGQKDESKPSQSRLSSRSSLASATTETEETHDINSQRKCLPSSSKGLAAEDNCEKLSQDKLQKMFLDDPEKVLESESKESHTGSVQGASPLRKISGKVPRKRTSSEVSDTSTVDQVKTSSENRSMSGSSSVMETYETSRRLTRHQRALLARSMKLNSIDRVSVTRPSLAFEKEVEGKEEVSDDDRMSHISHSSVRSSQRLRAKRQQQELLNDSPSSTASTIINPALTPSVQRRRRQSVSSEVSEINRDVSPVSSVRRRISIQSPGIPSSVLTTPTRRSARLSALHAGSQQSDDGDNQSIASMSPSSVASGRKSTTRRPPRRLSISSEAPSEQYAFASPQVEHPNVNENPDADVAESFVFSPPKTVATPNKSRSSSTDTSGSTSKKNTRQSRASALQTIKEESSTSRISLEDTAPASPVTRSNRQSWFFIKPPIEEAEEQVPIKNKEQKAKRSSEGKQGYHSAYPQRKHFSIEPIPQIDTDESNSNSSGEIKKQAVKSTRSTRQAASKRQRK